MKRPRVLPPVYLLFAVIGMIALDRYVPGARIVPESLRPIGWAVMVLGLMLGGWAVALLRGHRTAIKPGEAPTALVVAGPFRFSRNPIYIGMALVLVGLAVRLGSLSPWILVPAFVFVIARNIIPVEEGILEENLGEAYRRYRSSVRRWL